MADKTKEIYEALRDGGKSKESAARIAQGKTGEALSCNTASFQNGCKKAKNDINKRIKNAYNDTLMIEVEVIDPDGQLQKMIQYIGDTANPGHSFGVVVDPDMSEHKKEFFFDGDGAFYLKGMKVKK